MSNRFESLAAPGVRRLAPYVPGKPPEQLERELGIAGSIKLASNENPLGPSPKAVAAITAALASLHRYPDGSAFYLTRRLAERRMFPAIDVDQSSTRHEELLFDRDQLKQVWKLRRVLSALESDRGERDGSSCKGLELLLDKLRSTSSNDPTS